MGEHTPEAGFTMHGGTTAGKNFSVPREETTQTCYVGVPMIAHKDRIQLDYRDLARASDM